MSFAMINHLCRHFKGSKPCNYNKYDGSECPNCVHVSTFGSRILIIKLEAIGDVLRTGSFVPIIARKHGSPYICWMTRPETVDLVRMIEGVDEVIPFDVEGMARLSAGGWDHVYALSNDFTTASLATLAKPRHPPVGYWLQGGQLHPSNQAAEHWLQLGSFDRLKKANTKSYQQLMLEIIGETGRVDPPPLKVDDGLLATAARQVSSLFAGRTRRRVGVNIGSSGRWPKKMLDAQQIARYVELVLSRLDVDVLLLGGTAEKEKADEILQRLSSNDAVRASLTGHSLPQFVAVLAQVDALLCGDTLALHVASGLRVPTVCVIGPTSAAEIGDFDGLILKMSATELDCLCCYGDCQKAANCMSVLDLDELVRLTILQLDRAQAGENRTRSARLAAGAGA
jgi:heptosyltransferase-2